MCVTIIHVEQQNKQGFHFPYTKGISIYEALSSFSSITHILYKFLDVFMRSSHQQFATMPIYAQYPQTTANTSAIYTENHPFGFMRLIIIHKENGKRRKRASFTQNAHIMIIKL